MNLIKVKCAFCGNNFFRSNGRVNEAKKFNWKQYCSLHCLSRARQKRVKIICANCKKEVFRAPSDLKESKSGRRFCSLLCGAFFNNALRKGANLLKRKTKTCPSCGKQFKQFPERKIFCSFKCHINFLRKTKAQKRREILTKIKNFYTSYKRIPLKREKPGLAWRAQKVFGSWNKALEAAGFEPNPVVFSKKFTANDGHRCDSFAEKIIDDWLTARKIQHQREVSYPENKLLSADFVIENNWIEYFGLNGVIPQYDKLIKEKRKLSEKYQLSLIEIYPKDLFPVNHLSEIIKI